MTLEPHPRMHSREAFADREGVLDPVDCNRQVWGRCRPNSVARTLTPAREYAEWHTYRRVAHVYVGHSEGK